MEEVREILPTNITPIQFNLHFDIELDEEVPTFAVTEEVELRVNEATSVITANADVSHKFGSAVAIVGDEKREAKISAVGKDDVVTFTFDKEFEAGTTFKFQITLSTELRSDLKGLYKSEYEHEGKKKWMAVTQFEPVDARRAFVCWDQPDVKSRFQLSLTTTKDRTALGNMPVVSETDIGENRKKVVFDNSPVMSSYLLALVIGHFDYVKGMTKNGVKVRTYTAVGKSADGAFANEVGIKSLDFYHDFFGIPYPLPKLDMIAITDFAAGAMENWGLVTYRETALLFNEKTTSSARKQWVAIVVAHELAHQWFGNLVTMEWWNNLWLNESFATYMEYYCVDSLFPEWNVWQNFVCDDMVSAFRLDAMDSTHSVQVELARAADVDQIFDAISYQKGCSVMRMLADFLGEDAWRNGLRKYMQTHKYANTQSDDLWNALGEASGRDVKALMDPWIKQEGYPVLSASRTDKGIKLTQQRFKSNPLSKAEATIWPIPIRIKTDVGSSIHVFDQKTGEIELEGNPKWVKINSGMGGLYRVDYDADMLKSLTKVLQTGVFGCEDRMGIQQDLFALVTAGKRSSDGLVDLLLSYKDETDYIVWNDIVGNASKIGLIAGAKGKKSFEAFILALYSKIAKSLGWDAKEKETQQQKMLRPLVLCRMNNDLEFRKKAISLFESDITGSQNIDADLKRNCYRTALKYSKNPKKTFDRLIEKYKKADNKTDKALILATLGAVQDEKLLMETLNFGINTEFVASSDFVTLIRTIGGGKMARKVVKKFFYARWNDILELYSSGFMVTYVIKGILGMFFTKEDRDEFEKYFKENPCEVVTRPLAQCLEAITVTYLLIERESKNINSQLAEKFPVKQDEKKKKKKSKKTKSKKKKSKKKKKSEKKKSKKNKKKSKKQKKKGKKYEKKAKKNKKKAKKNKKKAKKSKKKSKK